MIAIDPPVRILTFPLASEGPFSNRVSLVKPKMSLHSNRRSTANRWTERLRRVKRVGRVAWGRQEYPFRADEHDAARQIIDERKPPCRHYARG